MTPYTVVLSERAKTQIDKARAWWQKRDPARIAAIDDDLAAAYGRLERFPEIGPPVEVRRRKSVGTRLYLLLHVGYNLYYRPDHEARLIVVMYFIHEARRRPKL
jgi:plasmid stabilization system protein ParE